MLTNKYFRTKMRVLFASIEWPFPDQPYRGPFAKRLADALSNYVEVIPFPLQVKRNPLNIPRFRYQIQKAYRKYHCDHLHCYSLHTLWMANFRKQSVSASAVGTDVYGSPNYNGRYPQGGSWTIRLLRASLRHLTGIRAVSETLKTDLQQKIPKEIPIEVLPNGIAIDRFPAQSRTIACLNVNWNPNQVNVLFPGNPERPVKNFALAQKWCNAVRTSSSVTLHTFPGVEPHQMNDYYRAADLVLITSYHEGASNAMKEALLCQTPVISTPVGDAPYWLQHSAIGHLIDFQEDAQAFQDLLQQANTDKRSQSPGINKSIAHHLGIDTTARQFADLLQAFSQPAH